MGNIKSGSRFMRTTLMVTGSRPRMELKPILPLQTHAAKLLGVGPMKPLRGPTPIVDENAPDS